MMYHLVVTFYRDQVTARGIILGVQWAKDLVNRFEQDAVHPFLVELLSQPGHQDDAVELCSLT